MALFGKENKDRHDRLSDRDDTRLVTEDSTRKEAYMPEPEPTLPAASGEVNAYLGKGSKVAGKLTFEGTVRVDGTVEGEVAAQDTLIVGDMVASVGTILIAPGDGDMQRYLEELRRLAALGAKTAFPAHGEPIEQPSATFERYVAHRRWAARTRRRATAKSRRSRRTIAAKRSHRKPRSPTA